MLVYVRRSGTKFLSELLTTGQKYLPGVLFKSRYCPFSAPLDTRSLVGMFCPSNTEQFLKVRHLIYEATISTVEDSAQTTTRIFGAQSEEKRQGDPAESPARRPETSDTGLTGQRMPVAMPERRGFGRASRIKQGRDFSRIRQEGQRLAMGCLIANWRRLGGSSPSRLGVITSGKIGNAVARNRARRLLRESFRLHQDDLAEPLDLVLVARPSIVGKRFAEVEKDFLTTLRKAGLLKQAGK